MHNMWAYRHQLLLVDNFNCVKVPAFMDLMILPVLAAFHATG